MISFLIFLGIVLTETPIFNEGKGERKRTRRKAIDHGGHVWKFLLTEKTY